MAPRPVVWVRAARAALDAAAARGQGFLPVTLRAARGWARSGAALCAHGERGVPQGHARSARGVGAMRLQLGLGGGVGRGERTEWAAASALRAWGASAP